MFNHARAVVALLVTASTLIIVGTTNVFPASAVSADPVLQFCDGRDTVTSVPVRYQNLIRYDVCLTGPSPGRVRFDVSCDSANAPQSAYYCPERYAGLRADGTASFWVRVIRDHVPDGAVINLSISNPTPGVTLGDAEATVTVNWPRLNLTAVGTTEGGPAGQRAMIYKIALTDPTRFPLDVRFRTTGGTATADEDYTPRDLVVRLSQTLGTARFVRVATLDDLVAEDAETVEGAITILASRYVVLGTATATATIVDND